MAHSVCVLVYVRRIFHCIYSEGRVAAVHWCLGVLRHPRNERWRVQRWPSRRRRALSPGAQLLAARALPTNGTRRNRWRDVVVVRDRKLALTTTFECVGAFDASLKALQYTKMALSQRPMATKQLMFCHSMTGTTTAVKLHLPLVREGKRFSQVNDTFNTV